MVKQYRSSYYKNSIAIATSVDLYLKKYSYVATVGLQIFTVQKFLISWDIVVQQKFCKKNFVNGMYLFKNV